MFKIDSADRNITSFYCTNVFFDKHALFFSKYITSISLRVAISTVKYVFYSKNISRLLKIIIFWCLAIWKYYVNNYFNRSIWYSAWTTDNDRVIIQNHLSHVTHIILFIRNTSHCWCLVTCKVPLDAKCK